MKLTTEFQGCAERLKALADPDRLKIVAALLDGPRTVGDLAASLDEGIIKVSYHLNKLREANILVVKRRGRFMEYSLDTTVVSNPETAPTERRLDFGCCTFQLT